MSTSHEIPLYALDGGWIQATGDDATGMSDDGAYEGRTLEMPVPCFLIGHRDGVLMRETGMTTSRTDPARGRGPGLAPTVPRESSLVPLRDALL